MPYSDSRLNDVIREIIFSLLPSTILDIGCGAGKYASLIPEKTVITGIEVEMDYITKFNLNNKYDHMFNMSVQKFIASHYDDYDLVILGDILEHLKKSDGIDVINFFVYHSKYILAVWPMNWRQGAVDGYMQENHISVWGKPDLADFEYEWHEDGPMRLALIKGYI